MSMGLAKFRSAAVPITALGVLGTFGTAPLVGVAAHYLLGFDWTVALLIGAALAPTDPAVTFSVLAGKEVEGRSATILEGESGFNDPVGIALMIGMIELATVPEAGVADVAWEFLREMGIGLAEGAVAGFVLLQLIRRVPLPDRSLYPLTVLLLAGLIYSIAAVSHGSGFLAVFVAGIVIGDAEFPSRLDVRHFLSSLADLGELAVFVALGLTINLGFIFAGALWWQGLVLAVVLGFVVRPLVVTPLLLPSKLSRGERLFVTWAGLKGAVPILLASLAVVGGTDQAAEIYGIVFVVVLFSVVVQGTLVPAVAARLGVPMVDVDH
jgi:cell volume regulation protein A